MLDSSFGVNGLVTTHVNGSSSISDIALEGNRLIAVGSLRNAEGTFGVIAAYLPEEQAGLPAVTSFTLVNASIGSDIQELKEGDVIDLSALPPNTKLNIQAAASPAQVGSLVLQLSGGQTHDQMSNDPPNWLFSDGTTLPAGDYRLTATPYSAAGGSGTKGTPLTVRFTVLSPESLTYYRDCDGDAFGDSARRIVASSPPAGYVGNHLDCNDYSVFYQDDDKDGSGSGVKVPCGLITRTGDFDDNNNRVHSPQTFYRDQDGDNFGDAGVTTMACSSIPPEAYVANRMDCNDSDPQVRYCPPAATTMASGAPEVLEEQAASLTLSAASNPVARSTRIQYHSGGCLYNHRDL